MKTQSNHDDMFLPNGMEYLVTSLTAYGNKSMGLPSTLTNAFYARTLPETNVYDLEYDFIL